METQIHRLQCWKDDWPIRMKIIHFSGFTDRGPVVTVVTVVNRSAKHFMPSVFT